MLGKVLGFPLLFALNVTETRFVPFIIIHSLELYERPISAVPFLLTGTSESRSDNDYKIKQSDTAISLMLLPSPPPPSLNGAGGSIFVALSVSSKGHSPVQSIVSISRDFRQLMCLIVTELSSIAANPRVFLEGRPMN